MREGREEWCDEWVIWVGFWYEIFLFDDLIFIILDDKYYYCYLVEWVWIESLCICSGFVSESEVVSIVNISYFFWRMFFWMFFR